MQSYIHAQTGATFTIQPVNQSLLHVSVKRVQTAKFVQQFLSGYANTLPVNLQLQFVSLMKYAHSIRYKVLDISVFQ